MLDGFPVCVVAVHASKFWHFMCQFKACTLEFDFLQTWTHLWSQQNALVNAVSLPSGQKYCHRLALEKRWVIWPVIWWTIFEAFYNRYFIILLLDSTAPGRRVKDWRPIFQRCYQWALEYHKRQFYDPTKHLLTIPSHYTVTPDPTFVLNLDPSRGDLHGRTVSIL